MLQYAITDRHLFPADYSDGDDDARSDALVAQARRLVLRGVTHIQLREKDLPREALEALARRLVSAVQALGQSVPVILLNGPAPRAIAAGAGGVHLPGGAGPADLLSIKEAFASAGRPSPTVSISCHSLEEVRSAASAGFDLILFGPIFEKHVRGTLISPGLGLGLLRGASSLKGHARLFALGGVTPSNAPLCLEAGADGIAGIRLFL